MTAEPLRRCAVCGMPAYRFTPCHTCRVLAEHVAQGGDGHGR